MSSERWQVQRNLGQWIWYSLNSRCSVRVTDWYMDPWKVLERMDLFCPWLVYVVLLSKAEQLGEKLPVPIVLLMFPGLRQECHPLRAGELLCTEKVHFVVQCSSHIWEESFTTGKMDHKGTYKFWVHWSSVPNFPLLLCCGFMSCQYRNRTFVQDCWLWGNLRN